MFFRGKKLKGSLKTGNNESALDKIKNGKVYITDVFDTRQNPEKIKTRNK
jgi:hypothetical protein